jgi:cytochrome P450
MREGVRATDQTGHRSATEDLPVLTTERLDADPHGIFRSYRRTNSLVAHEAGGYFVLRLADVEPLSKDPRARASETAFPEMHSVTDGALFDTFRFGMLTANGATHRHRRSPFSRTFAARMITELRPHIRRSAEELVDRWYADGQVDFLEEFAAQVPARIISDLMGLPREDIPSFTRLVYQVSRFISFSFTPDEVPDIEAAARQLQAYVERTLNHRRGAPCGDFLSGFVTTADDAGEMSPIEIIFQIVQLIIGGTDTTRVALVMQVALLLQHHEQWTAVCRDPALIPAAVEESMRFEPSVASVSRVAAEDIDIDSAVIPAGKFVTLSTMSGMRDERAYDDPDVFNIRRVRQPRLHPIFGGGPHRCIGEALARAELEESLAVLIARIPQLRLDQPPAIKGHSGIRRVDAIRVSWRVRA